MAEDHSPRHTRSWSSPVIPRLNLFNDGNTSPLPTNDSEEDFSILFTPRTTEKLDREWERYRASDDNELKHKVIRYNFKLPNERTTRSISILGPKKEESGARGVLENLKSRSEELSRESLREREESLRAFEQDLQDKEESLRKKKKKLVYFLRKVKKEVDLGSIERVKELEAENEILKKRVKDLEALVNCIVEHGSDDDVDQNQKENREGRDKQAKKERLDKARLEKERLEKVKLEKEILEKEKLKKEKQEMEKLKKEQLEKERLENERNEKEKLEKERLAKEKEKLEKVRLEKARLEKEKLEQERLEKEKIQKEKEEKQEHDRARREKLRKERDALELQEHILKQKLEEGKLKKSQEINKKTENASAAEKQQVEVCLPKNETNTTEMTANTCKSGEGALKTLLEKEEAAMKRLEERMALVRRRKEARRKQEEKDMEISGS